MAIGEVSPNPLDRFAFNHIHAKQHGWAETVVIRGRSKHIHSEHLLVEHFIQIQQLVGQHCPGGKLRGIERGVGFRFANRDQLIGFCRVRLIVGEQIGQRRLDDGLLLGS